MSDDFQRGERHTVAFERADLCERCRAGMDEAHAQGRSFYVCADCAARGRARVYATVSSQEALLNQTVAAVRVALGVGFYLRTDAKPMRIGDARIRCSLADYGWIRERFDGDTRIEADEHVDRGRVEVRVYAPPPVNKITCEFGFDR